MHAPVKPRSFVQRHRVKLGIGGVVLIGLIVVLMPHSSAPRKHESDIVFLAPPPPPPPPPPVKPPPPKKMVEQTPVDKPEPKPQSPDTPKSPPIGPTTFGKGNSSYKMGGGGGDGSGGGSRWGWYASSVQNSIRDALKNNARTHHAAMGVTVRIWPDFTGRIGRVELVNSTGDATLDDAIKNQVLTGLVLPGAPPDGMPMPINLRISAHP